MGGNERGDDAEGVGMKPVSKQRRWQKRMVAQGRCYKCGEDAQGYRLCRVHAPYTRRIDVGLPKKQGAWRMAALHGVPLTVKP
jgi:hypothetical protein